MSASEPTLSHRTHAALAVASRAQLLALLRASDRPSTAHELAETSGLHVNTVRFHLDVLEDAGLVRHERAPTGGRGRPRMVYAAVAERPSAGYEFLAGALAEHWAGDPAERARRAERAGYDMALPSTDDRPREPLSFSDAVVEVTTLFAAMGFQPDVVPVGGGGAQIRLHCCPFRAVAADYPEVVCSMHLGMLRRTLVDTGGAASATRLNPFVEPELCVATITATSEPRGAEPTVALS
jgi:predicted ArsR family transcriptional regulator